MNARRRRIPFLLTTPLLAALLAAGLFSSCAETPSTAPAQPGFISLERTRGATLESPVYLLTVFEGGRVIFEGHANVRSKGTFTKTIPPDSAAALFTRLETLRFWERQSRYDEERSQGGRDDLILRVAPADAPRDVLIARRYHRFKRIDGLFFAPTELTEFKRLIEATVGLADWIAGPPAAPRRSPE